MNEKTLPSTRFDGFTNAREQRQASHIVPAVRFKADDGSEFPDWEEKRFRDIAKKIDRKATSESTSDIRMISQGEGFILQSRKYSRENAGKSLSKYLLLKKNEFAYNHGASKAKPFGVTYRLVESSEARVPYVYHAFSITQGDLGFWSYALNTESIERQLQKIITSGVRMDGLLNISFDSFMSLSIFFPCVAEQHKIASLLSSADEMLALCQRNLMQQIFSRKLRFKADDGSEFPDWEQKKLGDVCDPLSYGLNSAATAFDGINKFIRITDIDDFTHQYLKNAIVSPSSELDERYRVGRNDILFARTGASTGKTYLYNPADGVLYFAGFLIRAHVHDEYDSYFVYSQTLTSDYQEWVRSTSMRSGQPGINASEYSEYSFPVPSLPEQHKIASCLRSADALIDQSRAELEQWREVKKSLLQQLFV